LARSSIIESSAGTLRCIYTSGGANCGSGTNSSGCDRTRPNKIPADRIGGGLTWTPGCVASTDPDYACCGCVSWPNDPQTISQLKAENLPVCPDQKPVFDDPIEKQPKDPNKPLIGHIYYNPIDCAVPPTNPDVPKNVQGELMQLASEMDHVASELQQNAKKATDRFFEGVVQWVSDTATFMAQKRGVPAQQMTDAILQYLNNDNAKNHRMLYEGAVKALQEFKKDPAFFCGKTIPDFLPLPSKMRFIKRLQDGSKRLKQIHKYGSGFPKKWKKREDCFWQSMLSATGDQSYMRKTHGVYLDEIHTELKSRFGGPNALDPLTE
jgi:hypothetical protein